jgi:hypothetical protein
MGTRSLTRIFNTYKNENKNKQVKIQLVNMYRQYDGYPDGHGTELADFLKSGKVVNGIGSTNETERLFNGAGCLAAQMIAHFKNGAGGFYIEPITAKDCGQEFEYEVIVDFDTKQVTMKCFEIGYINKKGEYKNGKKLLFEGKPSEFDEFVKKLEESV